MKTRANLTNKKKSVLTSGEMLMVRGGTEPIDKTPK